MENMVIREAAKAAGVHLWEIAERYGVNDGNFSRKLRRELPDNERDRVLAIIDSIAKERQ
jgi:hypothetical protein